MRPIANRGTNPGADFFATFMSVSVGPGCTALTDPARSEIARQGGNCALCHGSRPRTPAIFT
jgi:hypothetical protein